MDQPSGTWPVRSGPRHCAQSSARSPPTTKRVPKNRASERQGAEIMALQFSGKGTSRQAGNTKEIEVTIRFVDQQRSSVSRKIDKLRPAQRHSSSEQPKNQNQQQADEQTRDDG